MGAQIRALEARLGVRLLQRSTPAVRLTEAGAVDREALAGTVERVRDAEFADTTAGASPSTDLGTN